MVGPLLNKSKSTVDLPLKLSDANFLYMDNAHYFGLIVLILFVREGVRKRYCMLL